MASAGALSFFAMAPICCNARWVVSMMPACCVPPPRAPPPPTCASGSTARSLGDFDALDLGQNAMQQYIVDALAALVENRSGLGAHVL
eukprot:2737394-Pyramimonas_sp.AAC.1